MAIRFLAFPAVIVIVLLLQAGVCRADAIDGDWCSNGGKRMSIHGQNITTSGGKQIQGDYTRHAFDYVVTADEDGSGDVVNIILQGEWLAISRQGPATAPLKEWHRCKEGIS